MSQRLVPLALLTALAVAGCSSDGYYYDRNSEYANASIAQPLELPETRNRAEYQDSMPVPQASSDFLASDDFEAPRPQPLATSEKGQREFVALRQSGDARWLAVNAAPAAVWTRLQTFARDQQLDVQSIDAGKGEITTSQGVISVNQGLRADASEVRCQQGGDVSGSCLNALRGYLAASPADSGVSLAAQSLSRDDRVRLEGRDGTWQIDLALDTERSWAELLYQLQKNFNTDYQKLVDQNRSRGEFMVNYIPREDRDGGWLGIGGDGEPLPMVLTLRGEQDHTLVTAKRADGEETTPALARELLDAVASTLR
ncbi:hypothetical protein Q4589_13785 [Cobetia marina]|uniref:hypothetical protein n=1 Tax=Cobetia marina TaxID=28258 RepID=UPI0026E22751|nr:hypothetical protein [Cobetia marina]MDO6788665.1 hypothetical protein [Cobetia marina]